MPSAPVKPARIRLTRLNLGEKVNDVANELLPHTHHSELFSDRKGEKFEEPFEHTARIPLFVGYFFRIF